MSRGSPAERVAAHGRVIDVVAGELGGHHIGRHLDHDRAGPAVLQRVEGAAHRRHRVLGQHHRLDLLGDRGIGAGRIEQREHLRRLARMAERQQQHRRRIRIGRGDAGKRVLGAGPVLHREDAGRLAVLTRAQPSAMCTPTRSWRQITGRMPRRHRGLDDRRRREAEHRRDAFALQDLGDRVHDQHVSSSSGIAATLYSERRQALQRRGSRGHDCIAPWARRRALLSPAASSTRAPASGGPDLIENAFQVSAEVGANMVFLPPPLDQSFGDLR